MNRRSFLAGAGTMAAVAGLPSGVSARTTSTSGLSILQGYTTETTTQLSVDVDRDQKTVYTLTDTASGRVHKPLSVKPVTFGSSDTRVDKISFAGLSVGRKYRLSVRDSRGKTLDDRFLSTVNLAQVDARVGLMSCMNDSKSAKTQMWAAAQAADLDYMFFLGDSVYGDLLFLHGPSYLWKRYVQTRKNVPFYRWRNLKPVIAVWDDHDFGKNNADGGYKYKNEAYFIFQTFFAQEADAKNLVRGYGNSSYLQAFGQNFVFFDSRFYRNLENPDGSSSFLGKQQIDWMAAAINRRPQPTMIMQGSPFFGRSEKSGSSYQDQSPEEFDYFLGKMKSLSSPVIFGAGDLHYTEVSEIDANLLGYETFELISSSMHSSTKSKFYDNPNKRVNGFLKENFLVMEKATNAVAWEVTCIEKGSRVPFKTVLKVG